MYVVVVSLLVFVELLIVAIGAVPLSLSSALRPFLLLGCLSKSKEYGFIPCLIVPIMLGLYANPVRPAFSEVKWKKNESAG